MAEKNRMRETWDKLAQENPMYYIVSSNPNWDLPAFMESGRKIVRSMFQQVDFPADQLHGTAVDLGCGLGRLSFALAEIFDRVIGLDVSDVMIAGANQLKEQQGCSNIAFQLIDGRSFATIPNGSVDLLFSLITLQHVEEEAVVHQLLKETARILKPGGRALIQVPVFPDTLAGQIQHSLWLGMRAGIRVIEPVGILPSKFSGQWHGARLLLGDALKTARASGMDVLAAQQLYPNHYRAGKNTLLYFQKRPEGV